MILIDLNDASWILNRFKDCNKSSFVVLASSLGFSASELKASLFKSPVMYVNHSNESGVLLSLHDIELNLGTARIQLCAESSHEAPSMFLNHMMQTQKIRRLISYVFPFESVEIEILNKLGFVFETIFREHVFFDGIYQDILVYGLTREIE